MNHKSYHGEHATMDIEGFVGDAEQEGLFILHLMKESLKLSTCREVHSKLVVLGKDGESPPGFTSVVLIDESYITAHCYSDRGWLAIDVFTCDRTSSPDAMIDFMYKHIHENYPDTHLVQRCHIDRFPI